MDGMPGGLVELTVRSDIPTRRDSFLPLSQAANRWRSRPRQKRFHFSGFFFVCEEFRDLKKKSLNAAF